MATGVLTARGRLQKQGPQRIRGKPRMTQPLGHRAHGHKWPRFKGREQRRLLHGRNRKVTVTVWGKIQSAFISCCLFVHLQVLHCSKKSHYKHTCVHRIPFFINSSVKTGSKQSLRLVHDTSLGLCPCCWAPQLQCLGSTTNCLISFCFAVLGALVPHLDPTI